MYVGTLVPILKLFVGDMLKLSFSCRVAIRLREALGLYGYRVPVCVASVSQKRKDSLR